MTGDRKRVIEAFGYTRDGGRAAGFTANGGGAVAFILSCPHAATLSEKFSPGVDRARARGNEFHVRLYYARYSGRSERYLGQ